MRADTTRRTAEIAAAAEIHRTAPSPAGRRVAPPLWLCHPTDLPQQDDKVFGSDTFCASVSAPPAMGIDIRRSMGLDPPSQNARIQRWGKPHPTDLPQTQAFNKTIEHSVATRFVRVYQPRPLWPLLSVVGWVLTHHHKHPDATAGQAPPYRFAANAGAFAGWVRE